MDIEDFKNIDSRKAIVYVILAVIFVLVLIFGFGNSNTDESKADINNVEVESNNSVYDSKLAAYKDKKNETFSPSGSDYDMSTNNEDDLYEDEDEDVLRLQESLKEKKPALETPSYKAVSAPSDFSRSAIDGLEATIKKDELKKTGTGKEKTDPESPQINTAPIKNAQNESLAEEKKTSRFYRAEKRKEKGNIIPAITHGDQEVTDGSSILFRTLEDLYTDENILIPRNTYITGVVKLTPQRMSIELQSVKVGKNIHPIKKKVFDTDGLQGLEIDNDAKTKIAKQASARAIESTNTTSESGSKNILNTTADAIGDAAKSVLAKEQREVKIKVKNNRKIFLQ